MATMSAKEIIKARGGYRAVAAALSTPRKPFPVTTVHSWYRADRLPPWREEAVLAIPLNPERTAKPKRRAAAAGRACSPDFPPPTRTDR